MNNYKSAPFYFSNILTFRLFLFSSLYSFLLFNHTFFESFRFIDVIRFYFTKYFFLY